MENQKNQTLTKNTLEASACCTPKNNETICCTPSKSKNETGEACCPQPSDGSACCNK